MKGARVQTDMEYTSSSCVWKNQIAYILCVSRRVHWYALPPCTLWKALASDTNPVPPLAEFCVPCVPSGTGGPPTVSRPTKKPPKAPVLPPGGPVWRFPPQVGERPVPARSGAGLGPTGPSLAEVTGEAGKPFFVFCFSQAGNKTHRSLKPTHSSLLGRASRAPARRCRSAQKAGRSPHPLCRKERSL